MKVIYTIGYYTILEKKASLFGSMTGEEFHGFKNRCQGKVSKVMGEYPPLPTCYK